MPSLVRTLLVPALVASFTPGVLLNSGGAPPPSVSAGASPVVAATFPMKETLSYRIEWRMITAGTADLDLSPISAQTWETKVKLRSAGLVNRLYYVHDDYLMRSDKQFCAATSSLDAAEGKRRRITTLNFDSAQKRVHYQERDLVKTVVNNRELEVPICTREVVGALAYLRSHPPDVGKSTQVVVTDGKRLANVKIEAQERENINISGKNYSTVRYEAFVFDNVLYQRKGMLHIWLTDDPDHIPVQMRIGLGFPVYNILLLLDKREK